VEHYCVGQLINGKVDDELQGRMWGMTAGVPGLVRHDASLR
jgi:hypothetical protein